MEDNEMVAAQVTPQDVPTDPTTYVPEQVATLNVRQSPDEPASVGPKVAVVPVATNEFRITLDGRAIGHALAPHEAPIVKSWMESVVAEGGV